MTPSKPSSGLRHARLAALAVACVAALVPAAAADAAKCTQKGTKKADLLKGTGKKDVLCGKGGDDVLLGKGGNDVLKGGGGNDALTAKAGNDTLSGGAGDDSLGGGKGNDKLKGAAGTDVAAFADSGSAMTVDLGAGTATGAGADTVATVENVIGSPFADKLTGDANANELSAGDGDDTVQGGAGDDALKGQAGVDSTSFAALGGPVVADLHAGTISGEGNDSVSGVENLTGTEHGDTIAGDDADNVLAGGGGSDTLSFAGSPTPVEADLGVNFSIGDGNDTFSGFEHLLGSANADKLIGDGAPNTITGGDGNDTLLGEGANDTLQGGAGSDTADYASSVDPITADLRASSVTGQGNDSLASVENLTGSPHGDTISGDAADNVLDGAGGTDTVSFTGAPALIDTSLATGVTAGDGTDTVLRFENAIGSPHNDSIAGSAENNLITGGPGDDTLASAAGDDQIIGEAGDDRLFGGEEDDLISGGADDDMLDGGGGSNDCDGGTGVNTFANGCDGLPPVLSNFGLSPTTIDTSGGPQTIDFTLTISDDAAGVDPTLSKVIVHAPSGSPTFEDTITPGVPSGNYTAQITLPQHAASGTWTVEVFLIDQAGNSVLITSAQLAADGRPNSFVQSGVGDDAAPELTDFDRSPATIDTNAADRVVGFDLDLSDNLAGVDEAASRVIVHGPSGDPSFESELTLTGGDPLSGVYHADVTIPRYSAPGTWTIEVLLVDRAANAQTIATAELASNAFPSTFDQTGLGDTLNPILTAFDRTPAQINTAELERTVDFTLSAGDDLSGIDPVASRVIALDPVNQPRFESPLTLAGGTSLNGSYTASIVFPQGSATGTWKLQLELVDEVGNVELVTPAELAAAGFPSNLQNVAPSGT